MEEGCATAFRLKRRRVTCGGAEMERGIQRSLSGGELEALRDTLGAGVGLEAGEEVVDELHAAGCSGAAGQQQRLGGRCGGAFGFVQVEVARGAVGEEDTAGLVSGGGQQLFAFGDELVGAAGVAEVHEGLPGIDGEIGFGDPGAPGGPVAADVAQVLLGRGEGAQHRAAFILVASGGEGTGQAQLKQTAGGWVLGAGQGVMKDLCLGRLVAAPGGLVGEVAEEAGAEVVVRPRGRCTGRRPGRRWPGRW